MGGSWNRISGTFSHPAVAIESRIRVLGFRCAETANSAVSSARADVLPHCWVRKRESMTRRVNLHANFNSNFLVIYWNMQDTALTRQLRWTEGNSFSKHPMFLGPTVLLQPSCLFGHACKLCWHRQIKPGAMKSRSQTLHVPYIGALIVRIGFWGPLCYNYNQEPPK